MLSEDAYFYVWNLGVDGSLPLISIYDVQRSRGTLQPASANQLIPSTGDNTPGESGGFGLYPQDCTVAALSYNLINFLDMRLASRSCCLPLRLHIFRWRPYPKVVSTCDDQQELAEQWSKMTTKITK